MDEYHKIDTVFKRNERGKILIGEYSRPEFEYLRDKPWLWTEKINGTNVRVMYYTRTHKLLGGYEEYNTALEFGGKTDNAQIPAKLVQYLRETFTVEKMIESFGDASKQLDTRVCLYGEGYGAGIQNGGNYSLDQKFILFDVKIGEWWLERANIEDIATKLGIDVVPVANTMQLLDAIEFVRHPEASLFSSKAVMEGLVGTPVVPLFNRKGERIITKIKYKDFK